VIDVTVVQTIEQRQAEAFVRGADEAMIEARGYGLTNSERAEVEAEARGIYTS
jgi:hypothetical protein